MCFCEQDYTHSEPPMISAKRMINAGGEEIGKIKNRKEQKSKAQMKCRLGFVGNTEKKNCNGQMELAKIISLMYEIVFARFIIKFLFVEFMQISLKRLCKLLPKLHLEPSFLYLFLAKLQK